MSKEENVNVLTNAYDCRSEVSKITASQIKVYNFLRMAIVRDVKSPVRGTNHSAGLDFFIPNDWNDGEQFLVGAGQQVLIPSGVHIDLLGSGLEDYALIFNNKSGVATKKHMLVGAQVVDADYQGEVHINVHNVGEDPIYLRAGDKLIQGLILPVVYAVPEFHDIADLYRHETERGAGGFGSTGA